MIVEFTGCSGAGKTSLARRVYGNLRAHGRPAAQSYERFLVVPFTNLAHQSGAVSAPAANRVVELLGWPWTILARRRFAECDRWVRLAIRDASISWVEWVRLSRSWNRKMAVMARCLHRSVPEANSWDDRLLLQDEGTVHFATSLLARSPARVAESLDRYLDLIPLPDCIVCVGASQRRTVKRLARRDVAPAPDRQGPAHHRFLARSRDVVRRLREHPRVAPRMLCVHNDTDDPISLDALAEDVVRHLNSLVVSAEPPSICSGLGHNSATPAAPAA